MPVETTAAAVIERAPRPETLPARGGHLRRVTIGPGAGVAFLALESRQRLPSTVYIKVFRQGMVVKEGLAAVVRAILAFQPVVGGQFMVGPVHVRKKTGQGAQVANGGIQGIGEGQERHAQPRQILGEGKKSRW
jgi:hypothetical protein